MTEPIIELIMCVFWGQHSPHIRCKRVKCDECGCAIAISERTLPLVKERKMKLYCLPCSLLIQLREEMKGEENVFMGVIREGKLPGGVA